MGRGVVLRATRERSAYAVGDERRGQSPCRLVVDAGTDCRVHLGGSRRIPSDLKEAQILTDNPSEEVGRPDEDRLPPDGRMLKILRSAPDELADLEYRALFDPATRLAKPALFRDRLETALAQAERERRMTGLLFVHIEIPPDLAPAHGKSLDLLPLIAGRLRSAVRPGDTVGRVGELDFVMLVNDLVEESDLELISERVREVIGVRVFLDESRSVLAADVDTRLARPGDRAVDLLER